MAQIFWSAEDYAVGAVPNDFWQVDLGTITTVIKQDVNGLKYMEVSGPDMERSYLSVIGAGLDVENAEIWSRFMSCGDKANFSFSQRATGVTDSLTIYDLRLTYQDAAGQNRLETYSSKPSGSVGSVVGSNTIASQSLVPGTNILAEQRGKAEGYSLKGKWWAAANPEPAAWSLEGTQDTIVGAGRAGIFSFRPFNLRVYAYGLGTHGDAAPTAPLDTVPATPTSLGVTDVQVKSSRLTWNQG